MSETPIRITPDWAAERMSQSVISTPVIGAGGPSQPTGVSSLSVGQPTIRMPSPIDLVARVVQRIRTLRSLMFDAGPRTRMPWLVPRSVAGSTVSITSSAPDSNSTVTSERPSKRMAAPSED